MILNVTCNRNITVVIVCRAEIVVITVLIKAVGVQREGRCWCRGKLIGINCSLVITSSYCILDL